MSEGVQTRHALVPHQDRQRLCSDHTFPFAGSIGQTKTELQPNAGTPQVAGPALENVLDGFLVVTREVFEARQSVEDS